MIEPDDNIDHFGHPGDEDDLTDYNQNESDEYCDELRDAGRNPDGSGESYAERNL